MKSIDYYNEWGKYDPIYQNAAYEDFFLVEEDVFTYYCERTNNTINSLVDTLTIETKTTQYGHTSSRTYRVKEFKFDRSIVYYKLDGSIGVIVHTSAYGTSTLFKPANFDALYSPEKELVEFTVNNDNILMFVMQKERID